jgi:hypothetical protein
MIEEESQHLLLHFKYHDLISQFASTITIGENRNFSFVKIVFGVREIPPLSGEKI